MFRLLAQQKNVTILNSHERLHAVFGVPLNERDFYTCVRASVFVRGFVGVYLYVLVYLCERLCMRVCRICDLVNS